MTQEEFTYMASEIRAKAVSIAGHFGYGTDDSEDIAQDVMLRLWSLHEQLTDATHLNASAVITAKRACIDRWRTTHQYKEIMQAGLECIGDIDAYSVSEVIMLAAKSLMAISEDFVLDISHLGIISSAIDSLGVSNGAKSKILAAISDKNLHSALAVCSEEGVEKEKTAVLSALITSYGEPHKVLSEILPYLDEGGKNAAEDL